MTFCSVNLTQQGREKLFATIVALNIIQMLLGFLLIYISITAVTWKVNEKIKYWKNKFISTFVSTYLFYYL